MTITNDPTTTPEVPAWLNLDGYLPRELRERVARVRSKIADLLPEIAELGKEIAEVELDVDCYQEPLHITLDDHCLILDPWCGLDSLRHEAVQAADHLLAGFGETVEDLSPAWYLDMLEERLDRLSTWAPSKLRRAGRDVPQTPAELEREHTMDPEMLAGLRAIEAEEAQA